MTYCNLLEYKVGTFGWNNFVFICRRRKQPSTYDRFDLEDLSPNYCYVNLLRYDQHFEDSHIVDMDLKSR